MGHHAHHGESPTAEGKTAMKTETMLYNGERLPIVRRRIMSRKVEQFDGPQIPFHELLEAKRKIEHTPQGPRKIAKGKPMGSTEYNRAKAENPNRVVFGETEKPSFVFQLVVTFADFRFISAPWGSLESPPTDFFNGARIEQGSWLVLPDGVRVRGMTDADLPADERAANAAQLAGDALGVVLEETRKANDHASVALQAYKAAAKEAREAKDNPQGAAIDMGDLVRDRLDAEPRKILKALKQVDGHRETAARLAGVSQSKVSRTIFNILRPAYAAAGYKVLPLYLMTKQERKAHGYDANAPGATDGNKRTGTRRNRE